MNCMRLLAHWGKLCKIIFALGKFRRGRCLVNFSFLLKVSENHIHIINMLNLVKFP